MSIVISALLVLGIIDILELVQKRHKKDLIYYLLFFVITFVAIIFCYNTETSFVEILHNLSII